MVFADTFHIFAGKSADHPYIILCLADTYSKSNSRFHINVNRYLDVHYIYDHIFNYIDTDIGIDIGIGIGIGHV